MPSDNSAGYSRDITASRLFGKAFDTRASAGVRSRVAFPAESLNRKFQPLESKGRLVTSQLFIWPLTRPTVPRTGKQIFAAGDNALFVQCDPLLRRFTQVRDGKT